MSKCKIHHTPPEDLERKGKSENESLKLELSTTNIKIVET